MHFSFRSFLEPPGNALICCQRGAGRFVGACLRSSAETGVTEQKPPSPPTGTLNCMILGVESQELILINSWNLKFEIVPDGVKLCKIMLKQC